MQDQERQGGSSLQLGSHLHLLQSHPSQPASGSRSARAHRYRRQGQHHGGDPLRQFRQ